MMLNEAFKTCLWRNFGAAIDMLIAAITYCPDDLWYTEKRFLYLSYHTTIFLDYYLSNPVVSFHPELPYTITNPNNIPSEAVDDVLPNAYYSRHDMCAYLMIIREKCKNVILLSTEEKLLERWIRDEEVSIHGLCPPLVENYSMLEILFYNFRHVQHHVAQLNFILRQQINTAPEWVALTED